ncbi:MAG TPA: 6-hydroxymethylpterin diphosphokinase MptE-like protein, partial [bacterium]|nr:6-hydroxymethylpterin diphosphokinase MptE-like protein [bacterium]
MSVQLAVDSHDPLLMANLQALSLRHLPVAQRVGQRPEGAGVRGFHYSTEAARSGALTLVATQGDQRHYVHSKFDPLTEARALADGAEVATRRNAILLGLGLGYTLEATLAVLPADGKALVVEPDPQVIRVALESRPLAEALNDPRVTLLVAPTVQEAFAHWALNFSMINANGVAFVALPNIERRMPEGFPAALADMVRAYMHTVAGNLQTLMVMAHTYLSNTLRAVPHLLTKPGVGTLFGEFRDVPVICVAAGPSLDKQLPLLAQVQDRALIIACDTATRPLLKAGITPHLICAGDPQEANHRHIAGLASQVESYLCAEPMTYPASVQEFRDRLFLASFRDRLMLWIENQIGEFGSVLCWGS